MADFYCDISAVGNEYEAYADTPTTWGMPQDGNGKAGPGHSAAVAVATIDVAGCSASGTGTIGVLGVTVSSTLNASGAALATAIVAAINGTATAVTATYSARLLPLNRLIFARVNPTVNTQVDIMLRIAGTDWNGMTPTQANISPAATIGTFSGGADGPYAYLANPNTVFGQTFCTYGIFFRSAPGVSDPAHGTDVVHVRTRRSGVDLTLTTSTSPWPALTWISRAYLFDDGTIWSGDNGKLVWRFAQPTTSGNAPALLNPASGAPLTLESRRQFNLSIEWLNNSGNALVTLFAYNGLNHVALLNCECVEVAGNVGILALLRHSSNVTSQGLDISGCKLQYLGTVKGQVVSTGGSSSNSHKVIANGVVVEVVAATAAIAAPFAFASGTDGFYFEWVGGAVRDTNGVFKCVNPISAPNSSRGVYLIDNVAGVTDPAIGAAISPIELKHKLMWSQTDGPDRGFRLETRQFTADWKGDGTFPHCGAMNLQGDQWSHRITWTSAPSSALSVTVMRAAVQYRATAAVKTVTLELYVPDATIFYVDQFEFEVSYTDSSGVSRVDHVLSPRSIQGSASRTALSSSSKTWVPNGVASFSAKKIELTTSYAIKANSEVVGRLALCAPRSPTIVFYASPELTLS